MYDAAGLVETAVENAALIENVITVNRLMEAFSTTGVQASKVADEDAGTNATTASISIVTPPRGQQSSPPFNGTYQISCTDYLGAVYVSDEITYDEPPSRVEWLMMNSMGMMVENIEVLADGRFDHPENGISFIIHFYGLDYEVPLCSIAPSNGEYPLTGNTDMAPNTTVLRTYGESLFFPVIPFDQLHSDAQTPQILVTIDGMPALCVDLNCDFQYTVSSSSIATQAFDTTDNKTLTLTGTLLPNATTDRIYFGPIICSYDLSTHVNETIVCELEDTVVSGDWKAYILTEYGLIPNAIASSIEIPVVATAISPNVDVNYLGGDIMNITGDSFGYDISAISVTYQDGTTCDVTYANMTYILCEN
jgi:hypothetical protein